GSTRGRRAGPFRLHDRSPPHAATAVGAFPSSFTNYNFVVVRKLLPEVVADHTRALAELEHDLAKLPPGDVRDQVENLAAVKRMHLTELEKVGQNGQVRPTSAATP